MGLPAGEEIARSALDSKMALLEWDLSNHMRQWIWLGPSPPVCLTDAGQVNVLIWP
jgi:hypothetical protein